MGDTVGAEETSVFNGADPSAAATGSLATGGTGASVATGEAGIVSSAVVSGEVPAESAATGCAEVMAGVEKAPRKVRSDKGQKRGARIPKEE